MRSYPKKCPKCKEFMEPIFTKGISNYGMNNFKDKSVLNEPIKWECNCGYSSNPTNINNSKEV